MIKPRFFRILIIFFLVLGFIWFLNSEFFQVKNLEMTGGSGLEQELIIPREEVLGQNIFHIDREYLENYARQHSAIKEVAVSRRFPSTMVYYLEQREPLAWLKSSGNFFLVDEEGYSIAQKEERNKKDLPLIEAEGLELKEGGRIEESSVLFCLDLLANLDLWIMDMITGVALGPGAEINLFLKQGGKIIVGEGSPPGEKVAIIRSLLKELEEDLDRLQYLDLRFKSRPVYKLK